MVHCKGSHDWRLNGGGNPLESGEQSLRVHTLSEAEKPNQNAKLFTQWAASS